MAISGASGKVIPTGIALVEMACATHAGARESANATLQISRTERLPELAARMWGFVIGLYSSLQSSLVRNVSLAWSVMNIGVAENTIYAVKSPIFSPSSQSATDPLSDVLSLLKPKNYMGGGIDAGGEWCFYFGELNVTRCFALASGSCWLEMDGVADPVIWLRGSVC